MSIPSKHSRCSECETELAAQARFCPQCGAPRKTTGAADPLIGTVVAGRYEFKERIGHGNSGTIYRAEHVTLGRRIAVKVLHHELAQDELAVERFRREATTVSEIDNPHMVQIFDYGRLPDERLYLVMEFVNGESLHDALDRDGTLSIEQSIHVLKQVAEALMEAHAIGYVHRDLRPGNVFLAERPGRPLRVKLLDFGLAKLVEGGRGSASSTSLGMTFGDPIYMSPEQARGESFDRRADIYAIGCMGYQMLCGRPPFIGGHALDILTAHIQEPPKPIEKLCPACPPWLRSIIDTALAKEPDERFSSVSRIVEAIDKGQASGEIMSPEVARRLETTLPASVSQAMKKYGTGETTADDPAEHAETAAPDSPTDEPSILSDGTPQKSTGQSPPTTEKNPEPGWNISEREAKGKATNAAPTEPAGSGISSAWYADGESLETGEDLDVHKRAQLDAARSDDATDSFELYEPHRSPNRIVWIMGGAVLLAAGLVTAAVTFGGNEGIAEDTDAAAIITNAVPQQILEDAGSVPPDAMQEDAALPVGKATPVARKLPAKKTPTPPKKALRPRQPEPASPRAIPPQAISLEDRRQADFFAKIGRTNLGRGAYMEAARHFHRALTLNSRNATAVAGLGEIALVQGDGANALSHLKKAARLAPTSERIQVLLAEAYLSAGQPSRAATLFKKTLKRNPDNPRARDGYNAAVGAD